MESGPYHHLQGSAVFDAPVHVPVVHNKFKTIKLSKLINFPYGTYHLFGNSISGCGCIAYWSTIRRTLPRTQLKEMATSLNTKFGVLYCAILTAAGHVIFRGCSGTRETVGVRSNFLTVLLLSTDKALLGRCGTVLGLSAERARRTGGI